MRARAGLVNRNGPDLRFEAGIDQDGEIFAGTLRTRGRAEICRNPGIFSAMKKSGEKLAKNPAYARARIRPAVKTR